MSPAWLVMRGYADRPWLLLTVVGSMIGELVLILLLSCAPQLLLTLSLHVLKHHGVAATIIFFFITVLQMHLVQGQLTHARYRLIPRISRGHVPAQLALLLPRVITHAAFLTAIHYPLAISVGVTAIAAGLGMSGSLAGRKRVPLATNAMSLTGVVVCWCLGVLSMLLLSDDTMYSMVATSNAGLRWVPGVGLVLGGALVGLSLHRIPQLSDAAPGRDRQRERGMVSATAPSHLAPGSIRGSLALGRWMRSMTSPSAFSAAAITLTFMVLYICGHHLAAGIFVSIGLGLLPPVLLLRKAGDGSLAKATAPVLGRQSHATAVVLSFLGQAIAAWLLSTLATGFAALCLGGEQFARVFLIAWLLAASCVPLLAAMAAWIALLQGPLLRVAIWGMVIVADFFLSYVALARGLSAHQGLIAVILALVVIAGTLLLSHLRVRWRSVDLAW